MEEFMSKLSDLRRLVNKINEEDGAIDLKQGDFPSPVTASDLSAEVIGYLGDKLGTDFTSLKSTFDNTYYKLSVQFSPDLPANLSFDTLKSDLADMFGATVADVTINPGGVEIANAFKNVNEDGEDVVATDDDKDKEKKDGEVTEDDDEEMPKLTPLVADPDKKEDDEETTPAAALLDTINKVDAEDKKEDDGEVVPDTILDKDGMPIVKNEDDVDPALIVYKDKEVTQEEDDDISIKKDDTPAAALLDTINKVKDEDDEVAVPVVDDKDKKDDEVVKEDGEDVTAVDLDGKDKDKDKIVKTEDETPAASLLDTVNKVNAEDTEKEEDGEDTSEIPATVPNPDDEKKVAAECDDEVITSEGKSRIHKGLSRVRSMRKKLGK